MHVLRLGRGYQKLQRDGFSALEGIMASMTSNQPSCVVDTLHLSEEAYQAALTRLEGAQTPWEGEERRQSRRIPCRRDAVFLWEFAQLHSPPQRYLVRCRNISVSGAAFLHGFYVHPDTKCSLTFLRRGEGGVRLTGTVVRCDHLAGTIHDVGMKFDQVLDDHLLAIVTLDAE